MFIYKCEYLGNNVGAVILISRGLRFQFPGVMKTDTRRCKLALHAGQAEIVDQGVGEVTYERVLLRVQWGEKVIINVKKKFLCEHKLLLGYDRRGRFSVSRR
jgi:hypothetical protein